MQIARATQRYEAWLAKQIPLVQADIALKHLQIASGPFPFLRGTFYRWAQIWPEVCANLAGAPTVLAVGDLHIENFGTWRDAEGRLIWGINDFDESYPLPYTNDLVRLATSATLAIEAGHLSLPIRAACDALLHGYGEALRDGGSPFVLAEHHTWMGTLATRGMRDPVTFWQTLDAIPTTQESVPASAVAALEHNLPERALTYRLLHRVAGVGSLGRQRWVAQADWRGGQIAREAKPLIPSACHWLHKRTGPRDIFYGVIIAHAIRVPDPLINLQSHWVVRRLAPDCSRIELATLSADRDEERLLLAMGRETANIHLGTRDAAPAVLAHLISQPAGWLHSATKHMAKAITTEWNDWRKDTSAHTVHM